MHRAAVALCAALACALTTQANAARVEREYRESFPAEQGLRLHVEHGHGDVNVTPWDEDRIEVLVRYAGNLSSIGLGGRRDFVVDFRRSGATLMVVGREVIEGGLELGFRSYEREQYLYEIRAPRYVRLDFTGDDATVRVTDWDADLAIRMGDGLVELSDVRARRSTVSVEDGEISIRDHLGELILSASDGKISLESCRVRDGEIGLEDGEVLLQGSAGNFDIYAQDATVVLRQHRAANLEVATENGDIELDLLGRAGPTSTIDLSSEEGRISVALSDEVSAELTAELANPGEFRIDLPRAEAVESSERQARAVLGTGDDLIRLRSWRGGIVVRQAPASAGAP